MKQIKTNTNKLSSWIFSRPAIFAVLTIICFPIVFVILTSIATLFNISDEYNMMLAISTILLSFVFPTYYLIKKLPHDNMNRNDFIAIVNATTFIPFITGLILLLFRIILIEISHNDIEMLYMAHPYLLSAFAMMFLFILTYLIGVGFAGIYAKYKRCRTLGIDIWKIILSVPFGFLMLWMPGYLIPEKSKKSNLYIKSEWYKNFTNWILNNNFAANIMFIVLMLITYINLPSLVLIAAMIIIYTIWYVKHKSDFIKTINNGYALTVMFMNITLIALLLLA